MRHLVIGLGEVGSAILKILSEKHETIGMDVTPYKSDGFFDFLHICIPYSEKFEQAVKDYAKVYLAKDGIIVVHSSVPVGTCDKLKAVSSPMRGTHPNIYEGLRVFTKYFGGAQSPMAVLPFIECAVNTETNPDAKQCEAAKLWDTTQYGWNIMLNKAIKEYCEINKMDFDFIYTEWNKSYNEAYRKLGNENVVRPVLTYMAGSIGGHCVIPNAHLLNTNLAAHLIHWNKLLMP